LFDKKPLGDTKGLFLFWVLFVRTIPLLAFIAIVVAVALVYWPGLHGDFFFDDTPNILQVEGVKLTQLSGDSLTDAITSGHSGPSGRPVAQLSFALNHYFSGFDPFAFKATNLAIHLANGLLVFFLALRLLKSVGNQPRHQNALIASGMLAAVWLLHPIQLTTVLYVVQRMTSLSAFFLFAALILHMRAREGRGNVVLLIVAWGVLWPLSCLSKETGVLFPFFVLSWELLVRHSMQGKLDRSARIFCLVVSTVVVIGAIYACAPAGRWLWLGYDIRTFSIGERLLTEGRVLWFYLSLILFPRLDVLGLYHDDIPLSTGLLVPWTTLSAWVGLVGLVWVVWRLRAKAPLVSFGLAWFLIGHGLESTILPLEIAHEHRNYVPLFGILLPCVWGLMRVLELPDARRTACVVLAVVALSYFSFVTTLRAHQFGDEMRRTQVEAQHHPGSARAHYDAGRALASLGDSGLRDSAAYSLARASYEQAGTIEPELKIGLVGIIALDCRAGVAVSRIQVDELSHRLRTTHFAPGDASVMYGVKEMAIAETLCLGRSDIEHLFDAARDNSTVSPSVRAKLHSWLADYLALHEHDLPAAQMELDKSLVIAPYNSSNRLKRAQLSFLQGHHGEALKRLDDLKNANLSKTERQTIYELRACLVSRDPAVKCAGI